MRFQNKSYIETKDKKYMIACLTACKLKSACGMISEETAREQSRAPSTVSSGVIVTEEQSQDEEELG